MTRSSPSPPDVILSEAKDLALLEAIAAKPRPTGSDAIGMARERCAHELRELGFEVRERPFEFSAFPGRFATPLFGAAGAMIVGVAGRWGAAGARTAPFILLGVGAAFLFLTARWLMVRGVLAAPLLRERGVNLEATRPGREASLWLCAHLDTKSQPVPTLVRSAGIVLEGMGYALIMALALATVLGAGVDRFYWALAAAVTLVGAIPVVLSMVGSRSPGALDNASGVATVIAAARRMSNQPGVGVLLTDGEELGLAGARAWTIERSGGTVGTVLNCDGIDDRGQIEVMYSGKRPTRLFDALGRASQRTAVGHHPIRMIPGILTDSVAFAEAGMSSVTFSRGSWRSLVRVHSGRDDLAHLRGTGIAEAATLMAATVLEEMRETR